MDSRIGAHRVELRKKLLGIALAGLGLRPLDELGLFGDGLGLGLVPLLADPVPAPTRTPSERQTQSTEQRHWAA